MTHTWTKLILKYGAFLSIFFVVALDYCSGGVFIGWVVYPTMLIMNDSCFLDTSKIPNVQKKNWSKVTNGLNFTYKNIRWGSKLRCLKSNFHHDSDKELTIFFKTYQRICNKKKTYISPCLIQHILRYKPFSFNRNIIIWFNIYISNDNKINMGLFYK